MPPTLKAASMRGKKPGVLSLPAGELAAAEFARAVVHVSALSSLANISARFDSVDILTMLSPGHEQHAPASQAPGRHLKLFFHDIGQPAADLIAPDRSSVQAVLDFGRGF